LFGGVAKNSDPRTLSLTTCPTQEAQEPFAVTPDDAALCVVELNSHKLFGSAQEIVANHGAKIIFVGRQELVIVNAADHTDVSDVCYFGHFQHIADNAIYVAKEAIKPTQPFPADHPILQRFPGGNLSAAPNPLVVALINQINQVSLTNYVTYLSTDNSGATSTGSSITRNSFAIGNPTPGGTCGQSATTGAWKCPLAVTDWIVQQVTTMFVDYPVAPIIQVLPFRSDMCSNIVVRIPGTVTGTRVIFGAHLDSRMALRDSTSNPAPGADDNGSGSAVNLEILKAIANTRIRFQYAIEAQWYCGEEQGLLGSAALAKEYQLAGVPVLGQLNTDMIAYTQPGTPITIAFMTGAATASFTDLCKNTIALYLPTQAVGSTSACCSDQQSWFNHGYQSLGIFETATSTVVYPNYHRETDILANIMMDQVTAFGKGMISCIGEFAIPVAVGPTN
jgi:hypothetical protein